MSVRSTQSGMDADLKARSATRYRLVGVGRRTEGLVHDLSEVEASVIGRDRDCSLPIGTETDGPAQSGQVSRIHAVVESTTGGGWCVCDSQSTNGTSLLRQGLPPTIRLEAARHYPLEAGDVIELAGSADYQLLFQAVPRETKGGVATTQLLLRRGARSVQHLIDGHGTMVREVGVGGVHVGRTPSGGFSLLSDDPESDGLLHFEVASGNVGIRASTRGFAVNGEPLAVDRPLILRDMDLVTTDLDQRSAWLYLDPETIEPRRLSDLLLGAERVTFGSAEGNICRLGDPSVSRYHAVVWRDGSDLRVRDLGSANGTVVNERRVLEESVLAQGSRLWIGRLPFLVDSACWSTDTPVAPSIDIRFVGVSVEIAGKLRLRDVSLGVRQGEMVGVLGPSASGKSTLLRALAGQQRMASGDIYVNGRSVGRSETVGHWFKGLVGFGPDTREVGFVQQIDLLQPDLTVREILQFAARQMGLGMEDARSRADHAGNLCNLGTLLERVAISASGQMNLSGGQLKRVCVALEVLRQPRVLVLDEPTTGQDPKNTVDLMELFRRLANGGVTLLMSTHDLRSLEYFDKVIAVCLGYLTYFGPPGGFAEHFGADSAEKVYASLPDREDRTADAQRLADVFRATSLFQQLCRVE